MSRGSTRTLGLVAALMGAFAQKVLAQTATVSPPPDRPTAAVRLRDLVDILDRDNPELKALRRDVDMAVARIRQFQV